ncbi:MAG: hypothetical protein ACKVQS_04465 [Fimbriimonadaceae bacterium]
MSDEKFDNVRESAARYGDGSKPERDPKTGRFVSGTDRDASKKTVEKSIQDTMKRYSRALKKLAE